MNFQTQSPDARGYAASPEPSALTNDRSFVQDMLHILTEWYKVILGVAAAAVLVGLVITLLMTPQYTATTTIEISRESGQVTDFQGVEREAGIADQEFYQTQYGLLQARSLAELVANDLDLPDNPEFFEMFGEERSEPAFELEDGRYPGSLRAERLRVAVEVLLDNVSIAPQRLSRLVDIGFSSADPAFSQRVANSWASNFIQSTLRRKIDSTSYGREALQGELDELKQKLDDSQSELVGYAANEEIINLPVGGGEDGSNATSERSIVADSLASLNASLSAAVAERIQAQSRMAAAGRSGSAREALVNPALNGLRERRAELSADYERLLLQFEPGYPAAQAIKTQIDELDASIAREERRIGDSIRLDFEQTRAKENALQARVNELKGQFLDVRRRSIQYEILQQEVETNQILYDGLLQRFKEIGIAGSVGVNNISIVDAADLPQEPSSPNIPLNILISLLGGLVIGAALALALEQVDQTISSPEELNRILNAPPLGTIPQVANMSPSQALLDRKSELVDAYIAVQTNLSFSTSSGTPKAFSVTSTRAAEGKSTTALALAANLGRSKKKVLLVDADMRSPSVHHLVGMDHKFGLSNLLAGSDDIASAIAPVDDYGISVMTAGPIPPNAAELLTGDRLATLIGKLLEQFDHVVVDSPPVLGLADAALIANSVGGVIYSIESNATRKNQLLAAFTRLENANVHVLGTVLTKFDAGKAGYGYAYDYGYSYGRDAEQQAV